MVARENFIRARRALSRSMAAGFTTASQKKCFEGFFSSLLWAVFFFLLEPDRSVAWRTEIHSSGPLGECTTQWARLIVWRPSSYQHAQAFNVRDSTTAAFNSVGPHLAELQRLFPEFERVSVQFYGLIQRFIESFSFLLRWYLVPLNFVRFDWMLPGFTWYFWVLLCFTEPNWGSVDFLRRPCRYQQACRLLTCDRHCFPTGDTRRVKEKEKKWDPVSTRPAPFRAPQQSRKTCFKKNPVGIKRRPDTKPSVKPSKTRYKRTEPRNGF